MVPDTPTTVLGAVMLLGTAIVTALVWTIRYMLGLIEKRDRKIDTLQTELLAAATSAAAREREISQEEGPLLAAAAEALKATPEAFERSVAKVIGVEARDQMMRRLEHTVDELSRQRDRPR